ncbi:MAG: hypothetical protein RL011_1752, partial [Pseudomonadota bacterium]
MRALVVSLFGLLALAPALVAAPQFVVPPLSAPVVDAAQILAPQTVQRLGVVLRTLRDQGGSQVAVLTVPELGGLTIEQASIQVADAWKLGSATKDNGVLLMIAAAERAVRIEVGQGLEGQLTDAHSRRIIDRVMLPYFKNGDYDSGVIAGVVAILQHSDPDFRMDDQLPQRPER